MTNKQFNSATHFSIVWGVTLAVITLLEWHSLDRDPVRQEIISPFIERTMTVTVANETRPAERTILPGNEESPDAKLNYEVEFNFKGPLFLACFFLPVFLFHSLAMLWHRIRRN